MSDDILTAQYYDLTDQLTPGRHTITILVNNGNGSVPRGITGSQAWTEHTQSNWNDIIGKFCIEAANAAHIENIQVYPDIEKKNILVKVKISNPEGSPGRMKVILQANSWNSDVKHRVSQKSFPVDLKIGENVVELTYKMGNKFQKWSEFTPVLYKLTVTLKSEEVIDNDTVNFGMRKFSTSGTQFTINGIKTFLRGKHDACVFPLTGYPPIDVEGWRKVFRIAKSYNINFYRFHSWTPPLAAFEAADIEGISESNKKPVSPGTMSILTDSLQPLLSDFPTEFYTNWQWWPIVKNSHPMILDNTPKDYRPLVQVVDNVERNHKLGLVFEFAVGKGKLLVCMSNLKAIQDKPEGRQLYSSILGYMSSDKFNPVQTLTVQELIALFTTKVSAKKFTGVKNISYN